MDLLTGLLLIEMQEISCIQCAKMYASTFGKMRLDFNAVSEMREAYAISNEGHD